MRTAPYDLIESALPRMGLIVLQVDETIEEDMQRQIPYQDARLHVSRIPSGADLSCDTIAMMETDLPAAAGLLPQAVDFDVVGYGCTSGATLIGPDRVADLVRSRVRARAVTNPMTAALAAFKAGGVTSISVVSPYVNEVSQPLCTAFENAGIAVSGSLSFGEKVESRVARIAPGSIRDAALDLGQSTDSQAIFLSCTNLQTLDILSDLSQALGRLVFSSNQVLAWHMRQLAGMP